MELKTINDLKQFIQQNDITAISKTTELFGGADVCIVNKKTNENDSITFVVTIHAKELSWLFYQLRDLFKSELDHITKYEFYGKLAEQANKTIENEASCPVNKLLLNVLDEAEKIKGDLSK